MQAENSPAWRALSASTAPNFINADNERKLNPNTNDDNQILEASKHHYSGYRTPEMLRMTPIQPLPITRLRLPAVRTSIS